MRWSLFTVITAMSAAPLMLTGLAGLAAAQSSAPPRISGPVVHENLAVYFIHGPASPGKVPLTLEEALARRVVQVRETGNVNQLEIENLGNDEVFIQSGDIVKGGQQDRTLMVSLVLPPKSGRVPIASFCVEQGRWSARGSEDVKTFSTSAAAVPSREMKIAMKAPKPAVAASPTSGVESGRETSARRQPWETGAARTNIPAPSSYSGAGETSARQRDVWASVNQVQGKLTGSVGGRVNSEQSASSLQLALENGKLVSMQDAYVKALRGAGEAQRDIIGFVFAINGKLNSGDTYSSNDLFRKMWLKLLTASAIEAISHKDESPAAPPAIETAVAFLRDGETGASSEKPLNAGVRLDTREGSVAYYFETARAGAWVHRNYIAK
jgi:hypothetical protein